MAKLRETATPFVQNEVQNVFGFFGTTGRLFPGHEACVSCAKMS